jgi:hypothetical protein
MQACDVVVACSNMSRVRIQPVVLTLTTVNVRQAHQVNFNECSIYIHILIAAVNQFVVAMATCTCVSECYSSSFMQ